MRRSTLFTENENSDQSISDDDDDDLLEDHISLGIPAEKKGEVCILSQLDMLRDANEVVHKRNETSLLQMRQVYTGVEDDVEFPCFANNDEFTDTPRKASACNSDEEILSDVEVTGNYMPLSKRFTSEADNYQHYRPSSFGGNRKDGICTWLAENAETDALVNVNDNCALFRPVSAKAKNSYKGGQGKAKRKFSIRTHLHNDNLFKDISQMYESHTSIQGNEVDELKNDMMPASHTHTTTSIAELLLRVQDEHDLSEGHGVKYNKLEGTSAKRSILSTGHSDIGDYPDGLDSDSSEEDECDHQIQEVIIQESKQKTIADQFHEALGAASINEDGNINAVSIHSGLFGKLQHVIQKEKEQDSYFLNRLHKEDEGTFFDVKILSKSLEGNLTVCSCCSIENHESSTGTDNPLNMIKTKNSTIIFNSRICSDVELDVGAMVRIHSPWKAVNVRGKEESTILSTYFSQI